MIDLENFLRLSNEKTFAVTAPEAREMSVNRIAGQVCFRTSVSKQQRSPRGKNPDGTVVQVFNGLQFIACLLSRRMEEKE